MHKLNFGWDSAQSPRARWGRLMHSPNPLVAGASTQGGNGTRCTMAKIGGEFCDDNDAFARVYDNLLLHEYIYYFTPVHF